MITINQLDFSYSTGDFFLTIPEFHVEKNERVAVIGPSGTGKTTLLILSHHPAKWMIWEGAPVQASVDGLKSLGVNSLVFNPCGNVPVKGDFLTVMNQNVENLRPAFD